MGAQHKIDMKEWPIICDKYKNGMALGELSRQFDCSRIQIRSILVTSDVEIRKCKNSRIVDPTPEEIMKRSAEERKNGLLATRDSQNS
jgi:hypothetical protein